MLLGAAAADTSESHLVFLLDESGSMAGSRWTALEAAFADFLKLRRRATVTERVSVIQFSGTARSTYRNQPITSDFVLRHGGGGTAFDCAFEEAIEAVAGSAASRTTLVFMTDGQDGSDPLPHVRTMKETAKSLTLFTVGVGQFDGAALEKITRGANDGLLFK